MPKILKIEIEADSDDDMDSILKHVIKEISEAGEYTDPRIETNSTIDGEWLVINDEEVKGKYLWNKK